MALAKPVSALVEEALSEVDTVSPEEVAGQFDAGEVTILDVREPDEWEQGHIPGAVHVPRGWLEFKADPETPYFDERFDPHKPYVVQCAAGKRSALAAARPKEMGYRDVRNLEGGFGAWEKAGLPVEGITTVAIRNRPPCRAGARPRQASRTSSRAPAWP